jgi:hypothetical protein
MLDSVSVNFENFDIYGNLEKLGEIGKPTSVPKGRHKNENIEDVNTITS